MHALDELSRPDGTNGSAVHLEDSARKQNVKASDEPELQFHQPDEAITEENIIADGRVATPEQIVGSLRARWRSACAAYPPADVFASAAAELLGRSHQAPCC